MAGSIGKGGRDTPVAKHEIKNQMEDVVNLLNQRMEGQISNVQVESAVSDLLTAMGARRGAQAMSESNDTNGSEKAEKKKVPQQHQIGRQRESFIQEDMGNYDDSSDDDDNDDKQKGSKPLTKKKSDIEENDDCSDKGHQKLSTSSDVGDKYQDEISQIPMGKEAAKMMTTFGDGPHPLPEALRLCLLGTRKALQVSIMDARKIRRRLQKEYRDAQAIVMKYNPNKKHKSSDKSNPTVAAAAEWAAEQEQHVSTPTKNKDPVATATPEKSNGKIEKDSGDRLDQNEVTATASVTSNGKQKTNIPSTTTPTVNSIDPRLVYRALAEGTDKLAYSHRCGFHMEELTHLYPEEMRAYQRWNEMHEEYSESKADDGNDNDVNNSSSQGGTIDNDEVNEGDGGHLRERAANFDYRTDKMKDDWYVKYAKVRQGSFLPSARRVRRTKTEIEWDRLRKLKRGRHATGEWENISGRSVRFLHWLGFDPPNLYPPDEETTQALAFLAYDRLGRIVEKAIFLRNEKDKTASSLWEMPYGEQLSVDDIKLALQDPDIKPATVYSTEDSKISSSVQLYFGPGWEDRLELEMEE